jgi:hypothetical protein
VRYAAAFVLLLGCRKPVEIAPDPAPKFVVVKASADKPAPYRCRNGVTGLGTVGGFGGGTPIKPSSTTIEGHALPNDSFHVDDLNREACAQLREMSECVDRLHKGQPRWEFELDAELTIDAGVVTNTNVTSMMPTNPGVVACVTDALGKIKLIGGSGRPHYALSIVARDVKSVRMTEVDTVILGKLPPEVVKRIVRANFPRLRACYEAGLKTDPALAGVVAVRFRIDTDGSVVGVALDATASTLTDAAVRGCVLGVYRTLSFPEPEGGVVNVSCAVH